MRLIRKDRPIPGPRPPGRPPAPQGIRTPGNNGVPAGGMICPGATRGLRAMAAGKTFDETALETPAQKMLRKPSALGGKSIHLMVLEGPDKGQSFDITGVGTYTIGRTECDVVLDDEKISRKHASIVIIRQDQYAVNDLASRNGTFVNGARLTRRNLQHNDQIRVGNTTLRFTVFDGPVPVES